jgi:ferredoxin
VNAVPFWRVELRPSARCFDAPADLSVLQAAQQAGVALSASCRNGSCRACRVMLLRGRIRYTVEWPGLLAEEKAEGWILPCVARAESDLVIEQAAPPCPD